MIEYKYVARDFATGTLTVPHTIWGYNEEDALCRAEMREVRDGMYVTRIREFARNVSARS